MDKEVYKAFFTENILLMCKQCVPALSLEGEEPGDEATLDKAGSQDQV